MLTLLFDGGGVEWGMREKKGDGACRVIDTLSVHLGGTRQVSRHRCFALESQRWVFHRKAEILGLILLFPFLFFLPPNWVRVFHIFVVVFTLPAQK